MGGRNPFQVTNPVLDAVRGYDMVDSIMSRQQNRETAKEDRERRIVREGKLDYRQGMQWDQQQEDRGRRIEREDKLTGRQDEAYDLKQTEKLLGGIQAGLDERLSAAASKAKAPEEARELKAAAGYDFVMGLPQKSREAYDLAIGSSYAFGSKEAIARTRQSIDQLNAAVGSIARGDKNPDTMKAALGSLNVLYADQINKGAAANGIVKDIRKEISQATLTADGKFVFTLKISGKDANGQDVAPYEEVLTRSRGAGEDEIRAYNIKGIMGNVDRMATQADISERLLVRRAASGDAAATKRLGGRRDERAKLGKQKKLGMAYGGMAGFTAAEQKSISNIVAAGGSAKEATDAVLKSRELADKRKETRAKEKKDAASGKAEKLPKHIMALFEMPEQYDANGFQISGKSVDTGALAEFVAFKSRYGHDMSYEDAYVQFEKNSVPTKEPPAQAVSDPAAKLPGGDKAGESAVKVLTALEKIPDVNERITEAKRFLQSNAPEDVKEKFRYEFEKQLAMAGAAQSSEKRQASYAGGMAPRTSLIDKLRSPEMKKKGLIPAAAGVVVDHVKAATEDPRFPGWW